MNTAVKITAFAAALAASFGVAHAAGDGFGPAAEPKPAESAHGGDGHEGDGHRQGEGAAAHAAAPAGGLQVSESGHTLDLRTPRVTAGRESELRFAILDRDGRRITDYQRRHGKELHLILASRDLSTYRHLHPARAADGTWSTPVDLPAAGDYRVFADFAPAGKGSRDLTLGADLAVAGAYRPAGPPAPSRTAAAADGYTVTLHGGLRPGATGDLRLTVARDGRPVTDLQPYLGAYGHLVALRSGDLAYLHVHPEGEPGDAATRPGPDVPFTATAPSSGTYRLFFDFKHRGKVRTAAFTVTAGTAEESGRASARQDAPDGGRAAEEGGAGHRH